MAKASGMFGRFRKKPVEVEAMHIDGGNGIGSGLERQHGAAVSCARADSGQPDRSYLQVKTLNEIVVAQRRDWIVKGVVGEFYARDPLVFAATYELIE